MSDKPHWCPDVSENHALRVENERLQKLGGGLVCDNSELTQMLADLRTALEEIIAHPAPSNVANVAREALDRSMRA